MLKKPLISVRAVANNVVNVGKPTTATQRLSTAQLIVAASGFLFHISENHQPILYTGNRNLFPKNELRYLFLSQQVI